MHGIIIKFAKMTYSTALCAVANKNYHIKIFKPNMQDSSIKILDTFDKIHKDYINEVDFQHQTKNAKLASCSYGNIKVIDVNGGKILNKYKNEDGGWVMNVKFNPIMSNILASRNSRGKVRLYDIRLGSSVGGYEFDLFDVSLITESLIGRLNGVLFSVAGDRGSLQFDESGTLLMAANMSDNIKMIDLRY